MPVLPQVAIAKFALATARPALKYGAGFPRIWLISAGTVQFVCSDCGKVVGELSGESDLRGPNGGAALLIQLPWAIGCRLGVVFSGR